MYPFDEEISRYATERGVVYTRYADDLVFSTRKPNVLEEVPRTVVAVLGRLRYPKLAINERKTVFTSMKHFRSVTGLVLASQSYVSLGRERKRLLRAMIHKYREGSLPTIEHKKLKGLVAFAEDVEPTFIRRMETRYSLETLESIRKIVSKRGQSRIL